MLEVINKILFKLMREKNADFGSKNINSGFQRSKSSGKSKKTASKLKKRRAKLLHLFLLVLVYMAPVLLLIILKF